MKALIGVETLRKLPAGPVDIRDTKLRGFVLRVRPSGVTHLLRELRRAASGRCSGRRQVLTPPEAREAARAVLGDAMAGGDPIAEAKATAEAEAKRITFDAFCREHYTPWAMAQRKTGAEQTARLRASSARCSTSLRLDEITAFHVERGAPVG